ncbi:MAG: PilT/PilU family type 4a pilus ATPase [Armatimonadetes bacterium]|nr:PilT/PilU family type 4a pilus ATPase [Armatimonadota bacterium]
MAFDAATPAPPATYQPLPPAYAEPTDVQAAEAQLYVESLHAIPQVAAPVAAEEVPPVIDPQPVVQAPEAAPAAIRTPYEEEPAAAPVYQQIELPPAPKLESARSHSRLDLETPASAAEYQNAPGIENVHIDDILTLAIENRASDIHLTVGLPPMVRIDGEVAPLHFRALRPMDTRRLVVDILTDDQVQKFETNHELDFSYGAKDLGRFRFNVYVQKGAVAVAIRAIPKRIPSFEELGLPEILREMCNRSSGLILVTGPTGSGKSTTIATMLNDINEKTSGHIITVEDPIEYVHEHKKCMVNQREMHSDTYSFHNALRALLREDPDIILVGELRDLETIEAALTMAETGHLVFGTLHTRNAPSTIDRVIDVFPADQQDQIRVLLGNTLEGVISQQLLARIGGGRCAALEVMIGSPAIKNLIREGKTHQMYSIIETSKQLGMFTMDSSLAHLVKMGMVHYEEALPCAVDKENFARVAKFAA